MQGAKIDLYRQSGNATKLIKSLTYASECAIFVEILQKEVFYAVKILY